MLVNSDDEEIIIKPLLDLVQSLKKGALRLHEQAKTAISTVGDAKNTSAKLETHIAKLTEDKGPLSEDLIADAPAASTSISTAWDDVVVAYTNSLTAVEAVIGLEQSLNAIDAQLKAIDTPDSLGKISAKFSDISANAIENVEKLGEIKTKKTEVFQKAEGKYNNVQDEIAKLNEDKAVLDSING